MSSDEESTSDFNTFSDNSDDTFSEDSDSTDENKVFEIPFLSCCYKEDWGEVRKRLSRLPVPLRKTDECLVIAAKWATIHGNVDMLKFLLSLIHHNSLFQDEKRILYEVFEKSKFAREAACYGSLDCLEFLAEHCPSKEMILETGDSDHWTPAHYAAYNGRVKILKHIIEHAPSGVGVMVMKNDNEKTPLHIARKEIKNYFTPEKLQEIGLKQELELIERYADMEENSLPNLMLSVIRQNIELQLYRL